MISEQTLKDIDRLTEIAEKYANLLMEYGGSLYEMVQIDTYSKTFNFSVGPTTHGLSRLVVLPLSIVDREEELVVLAEQQKQKWKEEQEKNTCKCCGQSKIQSSLFI